ncbi:EAL domain-containing protein [Microvirga sp. 2TAF3]|uniref:EAL domain-containing protein n=1 Tax=Microvirga sp. 2TAF3 TaxID=3233014 RepID=UPI003F9979BF
MRSNAWAAIKARRIEPFYQPKISLASGRIIGFEALLRWRGPHESFQLPGAIQAAFDDPQLAIALGQYMQSMIFDDMRRWRESRIDFGRVAINASAAEFGNDDFAEQVLARLRSAKLPPHCLELEVTETVFLGRGAEYVERAVRRLSIAGVTIALDDFGTGYASLSHLKHFPVDSIKIDRSFVQDLASNAQDAAILQAILQLGKGLGIATVAEGIENDTQAAYLRVHGCDYGQGFLFRSPVPRQDVPILAKEWEPKELLRKLGTQTKNELWATIGSLLDLRSLHDSSAMA